MQIKHTLFLSCVLTAASGVAGVGPADNHTADVRRVVADVREHLGEGLNPEQTLEALGAVLDAGSSDAISARLRTS